MLSFGRELYQSSGFRLLVLLALAAFVPALGVIHLFDWDEINFAESAREMIETGDYFRVCINYEPFWEKPPLFFWLQAGSMHIFGVNEFAARFPNAICGILTVATFYSIGKKEKDENFGLLWGFLYLCSFLPQLYFRSAIIDPFFNLFIFISAYYLFKGLNVDEFKNKHALISGIFCGLAVLTKGPVGFLLVFLTFVVYLAFKRFKVLPTIKQVLIFAAMVLLISFLWFGVEVINNGFWFLIEFIEYQIDLFLNPVAGHEQPFFYHFVVVFFFAFPLSIFALPLLTKRKGLTDLQLWMVILFWVVMILFTIVKTKIVHYSSMSYLPLSFLAASVLYGKSWTDLKKYVRVLFIVVGSIFTFIFVAVPLFAIFKDHFLHLFNDPFAVAGFQNDEIQWSGLEPFVAVVVLAAFVAFIRFAKREKLLMGVKIYALLMSSALTLITVLIAYKIEGYSQRPMIEFYESIEGEDAYVIPVGFKSYAQFFYFKQPEDPNAYKKVRAEKYNNEEVDYKELEGVVKNWLISEDIDRDAYFVSKINHMELDSLPQIDHLYTKGGYKFFKREFND